MIRQLTRRLLATLRLKTPEVRGLGASFIDLKLAVRMLRKQPMLAGVSLLALGLGIPASLVPMHVWRAQMAPLPYEEGERIVGIRNWDTTAAAPAETRVADFEIWREGLSAFQSVAATRWGQWNVYSDEGRAEPYAGVAMSASAFGILRMPPAIGRTLAPADEVPGAPDVVVIGADVWTSHFGRDPDIVGRTIRVGGVPHTVVGVMPEGFDFPRHHHLWLPLRTDAAGTGEAPLHNVFGRLRDGRSMEEAHAEVEILGARLAADHPDTHARLDGQVVTMAEQAWDLPRGGTNDVGIHAMQLLAIVILLIVCGNVGIMILARSAVRNGEIAIRTALGASRLRIVSQVYVETLVLAVLATAMGLLVANWAVQRFSALLAEALFVDASLGWGTMAFAFSLAFLCAGVAGAIPALKATGSGIQGNLRRSAGQGSVVRFGVGSTALIVAQVALSVVALSFGVAWTRTVSRDTTAELGIELDRYLSARLRIPPAYAPGQPDPNPDEIRNRIRATQLEVRRRIESEPGVVSVAMARAGDLPGERNAPRRIEVEGEADIAAEGSGALVAESVVDVSFFQDLNRPILDGRGFRATDLPEESGAYAASVIVNTSFVAQVLGGRNPIGRRVRYTGRATNPWYEIVGVVGPLATNPVNPDLDAGVYHAARPEDMNPLGLVIETAADPAELTFRLRTLAAEVDPAAMIERPMLLSGLAETQAVGLKYLAIAPLALSAVAILLSAAGLYALMSFTVTQRRREIGLRRALGALPGSIVSTVGRRAFAPLLLGVAVGAILAAPVLQNLAENQLVKPQSSLLVVLGVVLGTLLVGMLACVAPTLRGLRIQPIEALKEQG